MRLLKKVLCFFLLLLAIPFTVIKAQQADTTSSLAEGNYALQFQISEHFNIGSFRGSALSYKRHYADSKAHRIGLSFSNHNRWDRFDRDNSFDGSNQNEESAWSVSLGASYTWMRYTNPDEDVKFYYGYGPGINFSSYTRDQNGSSYRLSVGASGIAYAGVEWFFQRSMSLHAEYGASLRISRRRTKVTNENNRRHTHDTLISLGGNGVQFGISAYF